MYNNIIFVNFGFNVFFDHWFSYDTSLREIISYPIGLSTKLNISSLNDFLDVEKFFFLNNTNLTTDLKRSYEDFFNNPIRNTAKKYFYDCLKDKIIISYHMDIKFKDLCNELNIAYIDLFETAYRFMQDSHVGISTNLQQISSHIINHYALSRHTMFSYANFLKSTYFRNTFKKAYSIYNKTNACLIICQTEQDVVLRKRNGEFDSLLNYQDKIIELSKAHHIYYRLHPLASKEYNEKLISFFSTIENATPIKTNEQSLYEIFSLNNITTVCGINSGSLYEASFFGKNVIFLGEKYYFHYQDVNRVDNSNNFNEYIILKSNKYLFQINFWATLLNHIMPTHKVSDNEDVEFENYSNIINAILDVSTSYEFNFYKYVLSHKN